LQSGWTHHAADDPPASGLHRPADAGEELGVEALDLAVEPAGRAGEDEVRVLGDPVAGAACRCQDRVNAVGPSPQPHRIHMRIADHVDGDHTIPPVGLPFSVRRPGSAGARAQRQFASRFEVPQRVRVLPASEVPVKGLEEEAFGFRTEGEQRHARVERHAIRPAGRGGRATPRRAPGSVGAYPSVTRQGIQGSGGDGVQETGAVIWRSKSVASVAMPLETCGKPPSRGGGSGWSWASLEHSAIFCLTTVAAGFILLVSKFAHVVNCAASAAVSAGCAPARAGQKPKPHLGKEYRNERPD